MPFVEVALGDAQEASHVPENTYDLRVVSCSKKFTKKAKESGVNDPDMYNVMIQIEGDTGVDNPAPVFVNLALPGYLGQDCYDSPEDWKKAENFKALQVKRFLHLFKVPFDDGGFNDEDIEGTTARALLTVIPQFKNPNEFQNELNFPRLPAEGAPTSEGKTRKPRS